MVSCKFSLKPIHWWKVCFTREDLEDEPPIMAATSHDVPRLSSPNPHRMPRRHRGPNHWDPVPRCYDPLSSSMFIKKDLMSPSNSEIYSMYLHEKNHYGPVWRCKWLCTQHVGRGFFSYDMKWEYHLPNQGIGKGWKDGRMALKSCQTTEVCGPLPLYQTSLIHYSRKHMQPYRSFSCHLCEKVPFWNEMKWDHFEMMLPNNHHLYWRRGEVVSIQSMIHSKIRQTNGKQ